MPLKRGRIPYSCMFCYQRKLRCNRREKEASGSQRCSACELRHQPCSLRGNSSSTALQSAILQDTPNSSHTSDSGQETSQNSTEVSNYRRDDSQTSGHGYTRADSSNSSPQGLIYEPVAAIDPIFDLSTAGSLFLDDMFMSTWQDLMPSVATTPSASRVSFTTQSDTFSGVSPCPEVQLSIIEAAIREYFAHVNAVLPIVPEEAFWSDYRSGVGSTSLTLALACRGVIFLTIGDTWRIQQLLGSEFRRTLLERQQGSSTAALNRIDELEALALMVDFAYDESYVGPVESHLGRLFLSFDSLVLSTLHLEQRDHQLRYETDKPWITSSEERRTILYWHVFGLDAFRCLDILRLSYIQDTSEAKSALLPTTQAKGYLDSILELSSIARSAITILHNHRAGKAKISQELLSSLYERLNIWRTISRPSHLAWSQQQPDAKTASQDAVNPRLTNLRSFVLAILELNCFMQIEKHVSSDAHPQTPNANLEQEIVKGRIELESLQAIQRTFENQQWDDLVAEMERGAEKHSFIDCHPALLRGICAGVYTWLTLREAAHRQSTIYDSNRAGDVSGHVAESAGRYSKLRQGLRLAIASATSHHDTAALLASIDSS